LGEASAGLDPGQIRADGEPLTARHTGAEIMRHPALLVAIAAASLATGLTACAGGPPQESYMSRTDKLAEDCRARGGILAPTGAQTGRPETDNICRITGGATRLPRDQ
jgi:hypothetical protein